MSMTELFKAKKVFLKVTETNARKGIETYCDEKALREFNPVYKGQVISTLQTALEMLVGDQLIIIPAGEYYGNQQGQDSESIKTSEPMEKDVQHSVQKMSTQSIQSSNRRKNSGD